MREARTLRPPPPPSLLLPPDPPPDSPSFSFTAASPLRVVVLSFLLPFAKHTIRAWTRRTTYARDCASYECPDRLAISVTSRVFRTERQRRAPLYCKTFLPPPPLSSLSRARWPRSLSRSLALRRSLFLPRFLRLRMRRGSASPRKFADASRATVVLKFRVGFGFFFILRYKIPIEIGNSD